MSMRMLLGYDPREDRRREDLGGSFTIVPRTVNATNGRNNKTKYQGTNRIKKLPPIHEELTPRVGQQKKVVSLKRVNRNTFLPNRRTETLVPVKKKSPRQVAAIQRTRMNSPPQSPEPIFDPFVPLTPIDVGHTIVDGMVADYLHYARYGHVIPVYEGTSSNSCPCCTDRNRQNVRKMLGFPTNMKDPRQKYDNKSTLDPRVIRNNDEAELESEAAIFPNSMYANLPREARHSKSDTKLQQLAQESKRGSWMNYQPKPYATSYLNAEFNRPSEIPSNLYDTHAQDAQKVMATRLVEADTNFNTAMDKLGSFSFGGDTSDRKTEP